MIKRILLWIVALVVVLAIGAFTYYKYVIYEAPSISQKHRAELQIMPLPSKLEFGKANLRLEGTLKINYEKINNGRLIKAIQRFDKYIQNLVLANNGKSKEEISLTINLIKDESSIPKFPSINSEEAYILEINDEGIRIAALTDLGVVYGLETVKQLIANDTAGHYLQHVKISDNPRFSWRGLMIDVSRHWIPKEVILRNLDAMVAVKMNVLHLHLSDDQGFRVESKLFPKLHSVRCV